MSIATDGKVTMRNSWAVHKGAAPKAPIWGATGDINWFPQVTSLNLCNPTFGGVGSTKQPPSKCGPFPGRRLCSNKWKYATATIEGQKYGQWTCNDFSDSTKSPHCKPYENWNGVSNFTRSIPNLPVMTGYPYSYFAAYGCRNDIKAKCCSAASSIDQSTCGEYKYQMPASGSCVSWMNDFCAKPENKHLKECECYYKPLPEVYTSIGLTKDDIPMSCYCSNTGAFKPDNNCDLSLSVCKQIVQCIAGNTCNITDNKLISQCKSKVGNNPTTTGTTTSGGTSTPPTSSTADEYIAIGTGAAALILLILLIIAVLKK